MKTLRGLFLATLACGAFAIAGEGEVRTIDLDAIEAATGNASSGQPDARQLESLAESGYVAVIDLRGPAENRGYDEAAAAEAAGLDYTPLPIPNAAAVSVENARKLGDLLDNYDGPVLVHCGSGNRVGALVALLEADRGASTDTALAAGRAAGLTRMEGLVSERLQTAQASDDGTGEDGD